MRSTHTLIVGGGVVGVSTAYHLAQRGATDVCLVERLPFFGMGSTGKCAGGVRYQFSTAVNIALSLASIPMIDRFEDEIGQAIDRKRIGYLFMLTEEADIPRFERNVALQRSMGVPTQWLSGDEVRRLVPEMNAGDVLAGTFHPDDGLADPNGIVAGYASAAQRLGATLLTDSEVTAIERTAGGFIVTTSQGPIACERLVNTAGAWAGRVSEMVGVPLPITPVRRQVLTTAPLPGLRRDFPFVIDFSRLLYFHPEGGGLLSGMSNAAEQPGFDETVDEAWELHHLDAAIDRLPLLETARLQSHWAGLYEMTPDHHPIISAVPALPGYYVAAGFSGHGFMHGPVAGKLLAEIMLDGAATTVDIASLDYDRFAENRLIHEYNVV